MLWRGATKRCARCGSRHLFRRWFTMVADCPRCGLHFEREAGYWTGALAINTILVGGVFAIIVRDRDRCSPIPDIPVAPLLAILVPIMVIGPLVVLPVLEDDLGRGRPRVPPAARPQRTPRRADRALSSASLVSGLLRGLQVDRERQDAVDEGPRRVADDREVLEVELRLLDEPLRSAPATGGSGRCSTAAAALAEARRASRRRRAASPAIGTRTLPSARDEHTRPGRRDRRARTRRRSRARRARARPSRRPDAARSRTRARRPATSHSRRVREQVLERLAPGRARHERARAARSSATSSGQVGDLALGDVRRVRHDQLEACRAARRAARRTTSPAAVRTRVAAQPAMLARATSSASLAHVGRPHLDVGQLGLERERDRTRTGAESATAAVGLGVDERRAAAARGAARAAALPRARPRRPARSRAAGSAPGGRP